MFVRFYNRYFWYYLSGTLVALDLSLSTSIIYFENFRTSDIAIIILFLLKKRYLVSGQTLLVIIFFFLYCFFIFLNSYLNDRDLFSPIKYFIIFFIYFLSFLDIRNFKYSIKNFSSGFLFGLLLQVITIFLFSDFIVSYSDLKYSYFTNIFPIRYTALNGVFNSFTIYLLIYIILEAKINWSKIFILILIFFILSESRLLILITIFLFFLNLTKKNFINFFFLISVTLHLWIEKLNNFIIFNFIFNFRDDYSRRLELIKNSFAKIKEKFPFGHGTRNNDDLINIEHAEYYLHSDIISFYYKAGLGGVFCILFFISLFYFVRKHLIFQKVIILLVLVMTLSSVIEPGQRLTFLLISIIWGYSQYLNSEEKNKKSIY